jgi:PAS domain S-box-containing protein
MKLLPSRIIAQGSFKRQIILTFVVGFFLLAAAFASYQVRTESAYLYRDNTDETISLAESLAASSRSWVLANDVAGLQEVVRSFQSHPELRYAIVISPSGKVLAHSDAAKVGQFVSDEASLALIKSQPVNRVMANDESMSDVAVPIMVDHRHIGWARIAQGREYITGNLHKMILSSALFVLVAVVLSLFAALFIANRLGYRIGHLMRVAEEVQAGNYATRANISGGDEIARLASRFNHMLDVLAQDEEQLRAASLYTRSLIEASLDPLVTINAKGKITDVNKATEEITGNSRSELIGTDFSDYFTEPDKAREGYQQVFAKGFVTDYPLALRHRIGHVTDVLYNASVYRNKAGEVLGVFAAARDVTERKQAETALREQTSFLHAIFENLLDAFVLIDSNGIILDWSRQAEKIFGWGKEEAVGRVLHETIIPVRYRDAHIRGIEHFLASGEGPLLNSMIETFALHHDGHEFPIELSIVPLKKGERYEFSAFVRDITERKKAEDSIREKEERLALATVNNGVGIWDWNLQTQEMIWDDSMYALYHIRREDFIGTEEAWRASLHPDDLARGDKEVEDAISGKKPFETEFRVVWPNGEIHHIKAIAKVFRDNQGTPLRMLGINMDVSERKKAEMELRELNNDFVTLLENTGDFIYFKDQNSRIRFCSQTLANITGHTSWRDMIGKNDLEIFPKDTARIYYEEEQPIFLEGKTLLNKIDPYHDDHGELRWVSTNKWPVFGDDNKTVVGIFGISHDITEQKRAEDALRESEEKLRSLFELSPLGIALTDMKGVYVEFNESFRRICGYPEEELRALDYWALTPRKYEADEARQLESLARIGRYGPYEKEYLRKDGSLVPLRLNGILMTGRDGQKYIWSIVEDITESKRAEAALRESEDKFKYVFDHSPIGNTITLPSGVLQMNHAFCEMLGYSDQELKHSRWQDITYPEDIELTQKEIDPLLLEGQDSARFVKRYIHKNGSVVWVDIVTSLRRDAEGKPLYFMTSIIDITERKRAEEDLRKYHEHLEDLVRERTSKLETANKELEAFSYSVSHDLRTPLRAIDGFSHILLDDYADKLDEEGKRLLNVVRDNTSRMGQLIDDILKFSRTSRLEMTYAEIDMEGLARAVVEELQPTDGKLQVEIEPIPPTTGDRSMMHQVFVNLLSNAIKFSRAKENAKIEVGGLIEGDEAVFYVKDNGVGFDMQYADKLFGVFQRLHSVNEFEGTGIGLAIVKRIITRHGGRVWAEGKLNEGATIYFALPVKDMASRSSPC